MGATRFSIDADLIRLLAARLPLEVFVSSGALDGPGVSAILPLFQEIHAVKASSNGGDSAMNRLAAAEGVHLHSGSPQTVLGEIANVIAERPSCVRMGADDAELEALGSLHPDSVLIVDASPGEDLRRLVERVGGAAPDHRLGLFGGTLVLFPASVAEAILSHAAATSADPAVIQNDGESSRLDRLEQELKAFAGSVGASLNRHAGQESGLEAITVQLAALGDRMEDLQRGLSSLGEESRAVGERVKPDEGRESALSDQLEDIQRALMSVGADAKAAHQTTQELRAGTRLNDLHEKLDSFTADLNPRLGRLDQQGRTVRATVGRLRDEQGATAGKVMEMRTEVAEMRAEVGALRNEWKNDVKALRKDVMSSRRPLSGRRLRARLKGLGQRLGSRVRRLLGTTPKLGRLQHHPPIPLQVPDHYRNGRVPQDPPTISIVTPSFNQGRFLKRTIDSVVDQDYPNLEYVIQDGGSDDGTRTVLERYGDRLHHWEMRDDDGQGHAINLGMRRTSGEIMAYLNSDDILLPGSLRYVARYFEDHPKVDAVYGHRVLIDERDREIGRWVLPRHGDEILSWADFVPQETLFWRRRIWEEAGGCMDEDFRFALDWDLLLRFRDAGARIVRVPRFIGGFRVHDDQKTNTHWDTAGEREMALIRTREHDREVTPAEIGEQMRWYLRRHVVLHKLYRAGVFRY